MLEHVNICAQHSLGYILFMYVWVGVKTLALSQ